MEKLSFLPPSTLCLHFVNALVTTFFFFKNKNRFIVTLYVVYLFYFRN